MPPTHDDTLDPFGDAFMRSFDTEEEYKRAIQALASIVRNCEAQHEPKLTIVFTALWSFIGVLFFMLCLCCMVLRSWDHTPLEKCAILAFSVATTFALGKFLIDIAKINVACR